MCKIKHGTNLREQNKLKVTLVSGEIFHRD